MAPVRVGTTPSPPLRPSSAALGSPLVPRLSGLCVRWQGSVVARPLLDCVLCTCSHPEAEVAGYSFPFWSRLSGELSVAAHRQRTEEPRVTTAAAMASTAAPSASSPHLHAFVPYFTSLIGCLQTALRYPAESAAWNEEQKDEHRKYRYTAADTLVDAVAVVGVEATLRLLWSSTQSHLSAYQQSGGGQWPALEASLHCFRAIGGRVPSEEAEVIPHLLQAVATSHLASASAPFPVAYTALLLIGRYSDWVNCHLSFLPPLLSLIVAALNSPPLQSSAAVAFKHMCDATSRHLAEDQAVAALEAEKRAQEGGWDGHNGGGPSSSSFLPSLLAVYSASASLSLSDQREIIGGMCDVVSVLPPPRLSAVLQALVEPIAQALRAALGRAALSPQAKDATAAEVGLHLDRLTAVIEGLEPGRHDEPHCVRAALVQSAQDTWPLLCSVLELYLTDERLMEKVCRAWRRAVSKAASPSSQTARGGAAAPTPSHPFAPLAQPLCELVTQAYAKHPQGSAQLPAASAHTAPVALSLCRLTCWPAVCCPAVLMCSSFLYVLSSCVDHFASLQDLQVTPAPLLAPLCIAASRLPNRNNAAALLPLSHRTSLTSVLCCGACPALLWCCVSGSAVSLLRCGVVSDSVAAGRRGLSVCAAARRGGGAVRAQRPRVSAPALLPLRCAPVRLLSAASAAADGGAVSAGAPPRGLLSRMPLPRHRSQRRQRRLAGPQPPRRGRWGRTRRPSPALRRTRPLPVTAATAAALPPPERRLLRLRPPAAAPPVASRRLAHAGAVHGAARLRGCLLRLLPALHCAAAHRRRSAAVGEGGARLRRRLDA